MGSVHNKESTGRRYKVLLLVYEDECLIDISSAKNLRNKFQKHKAGKCYETANWMVRGKRGGEFIAYLLEETETPILRNNANNLLLAWILYYKNNEKYKICNKELDNLEIDYPFEMMEHYKRICSQKNEPVFIRNVGFEKKRHAPYTIREVDKDADIKQMNIRITSETKERFQDFCDNNGISPSKAIEYLLDLSEGSNSGLFDLIASQEAQIQEGKEQQRLIDNEEEQRIDCFRQGVIPRLRLINERSKEFISRYYEYFLRKNGEPKLHVERFRPYRDVNKYQYPEAEYGYTVLKIQRMEWGKENNLINVFGIDEKGNHLRFRCYSSSCYLGVSLRKAFSNNDCDVFFVAYEKGKINGSNIVGILPIAPILYQQKFKNEEELERQMFLSDVVDLIQGVYDDVNTDNPKDEILDGDEMIWLNPRYYRKLKTNRGITENSDGSFSDDDVTLQYFCSNINDKKGTRFSIPLLEKTDVEGGYRESGVNSEVYDLTGEQAEIEVTSSEDNSHKKPNLNDVIKESEQQSMNQERFNRRNKF